jgi:hypothetical protein
VRGHGPLEDLAAERNRQDGRQRARAVARVVDPCHALRVEIDQSSKSGMRHDRAPGANRNDIANPRCPSCLAPDGPRVSDSGAMELREFRAQPPGAPPPAPPSRDVLGTSSPRRVPKWELSEPLIHDDQGSRKSIRPRYEGIKGVYSLINYCFVAKT